MVELEKIQMTDEDIKDKKLQLAYCKIQKDDSDVTLKEMEDTLDADLATRLLDDDIAKITEDIKEKVIYDAYGKKIDATEADIDRMKITLAKFISQKELNIPARQLRLKVNQLRDAKERPDAPELQIKKLERELREKSYERVVKDAHGSMVN